MFEIRHRRRHVVVGAAMHRMSVGRLVCAQSTLSPTGIETAGRHMACLLYTYLYIRKTAAYSIQPYFEVYHLYVYHNRI